MLSASRLKFIIRCLVSGGLIFLILRKVNWPGLAVVLGQLDVRWALLGVTSTLGVIGLLALRWGIFLRQQGIDLPYGMIFSLTWAGQFFNSILPGSTGGDLVKIYQICRFAPERKAAAASTVFVDRLSALIALASLAGGALLLDPGPLTLIPQPAVSGGTLMLGALLIISAGGLGLWLISHLSKGTHLHGRVVRTLAAARHNLVLNGNLVAAVVLAFGIHLLNFLTMYLFARALQIPITYGQVLLMMPVILFIILIPVTINGHGLRELLLIGYLGYFGVKVIGRPDVNVREAAVALSLVAVANDLLWSIPGGFWYLIRFKSHDPRVKDTQ